jgi:hypothetical protein
MRARLTILSALAMVVPAAAAPSPEIMAHLFGLAAIVGSAEACNYAIHREAYQRITDGMGLTPDDLSYLGAATTSWRDRAKRMARSDLQVHCGGTRAAGRGQGIVKE